MSGTSWTPHVRGKRHSRAAASQGVSPDVEPEEEAVKPGHTFCNVCARTLPQSKWNNHLTTPQHVRRMLFANYEAAFEEAEKNKHGTTVSHDDDGVNFGITEVPNAQQGVQIIVKIQNTVPLARITLVDAQLALKSHRGTPPHDHLGRYNDRIEFLFEDTVLHKSFAIVRPVKGIVGSQADHNLLKPIAPYVPRKRTARDPEKDVVPGVPPPALGAIKYVVKLPQAEIPKRIADALSRGSPSHIINFFRTSIMPSVLNSATHGRYMKTLIWTEEHRMEHDLQIYDIPDARLTTHGKYYFLEVPGLAEKRPSVLVGDRILVQPHGQDGGRWFEGHVHLVRQVEVGLYFHGSFPYDGNRRYHVRFKLNRIPLMRQHQALDTAFDPDRVLFPSLQHLVPAAPPSTVAVRPYIHNRLIAQNAAQLQAVASIAAKPMGSAPFVIFGPPGTGKTVTMVEAIRQVLRVNPNARVLACAPSNSAADLIASRFLSSTELFRFYAVSRRRELVPDNLLQHTHTNSQGFFSVPQVSQLAQFRVVVSTCGSASFAFGVGLPPGHFTHIFVDEAAQATEPETMTAMKAMTTPSTQVVLSGDPKQLGPIIRSSVARDLGLGVSYLERMMERDLYDEHRGSGKTLVKLKRNFRSHETILNFSNEQFYGSDLRACGPKRVIDSFVGWKELPNRKFPVIFHAVCGKDEREASSPSYFNTDEILVGKNYIQKLKAERRHVVADEEIGIITPYNAQARKFRDTLKRANVGTGIKVASVEEFQGDERRVIMLTTVRSSKELLTFDAKHTLGFVANPRRLNVAITRAKALLIVIGDPLVLSIDPLWRKFLNYVALNNGWRGIPISWDPHAPNEIRDQGVEDITDFMQRMQSYLGSDDQSAHDFAESQVNAEGVWREPE
ncbi:hypothetical protein POSPLADRAFT_1045879 [Postia placenta MAD-698-R-SB12]|uniref:Uncharacterized protein n=1 Tax=Postia placenta MAD-698-R-SB12 TaxID=670580 RepID=A0A1X6N4N7_9APHY|nr:hypothetical protein POSPLADRAFT_1045879 [Postia placenta MAD-698-R-SB12]OSX63564.1 hypothetical protein POSPLADRAFT_1045879 [Postia placenta MAD-698-R-SB12]